VGLHGLLAKVAGVGVVAVMAAGTGLCSRPGGRSATGPAGGPASKRVQSQRAGSQPSGIAPQPRDVPFRAMQVIVRRGPGGVVETRGQVARSSDGSTYVELIDEATKETAEVLIFDVPNHRELVLDVRNRRYRILTDPQLEGKEVPVDFVAEQLRGAAREKDVSLRRIKDGVESTWTRLGVKRIAGLESVGSVEVRRPLAAAGEVVDGPAEVDESWISVDLGVAVLRTRHDPLRDEDTEVAMTEIVRAEPEAKLFRAPAGYVLDSGEAQLVRPGTR